ncbi:MAG: hypothetical protein K2O65_12500 [Lachnospiraceae bacterium]|nr:hypothetical protein [Lachnospiraceae bacterium]
MARDRGMQENRSRKNTECEITITIIRDWIGFFLTVTGFFLSLSETVHIDVQIQRNIDIDVYISFFVIDDTQRNMEYHPSNPDDTVNNKKRDNSGGQRHPIEWAYIDLTDYLQEKSKRNNQRIER